MRSTNRILNRLAKPESIFNEMIVNYAQNPFHIDMPKYCTEELVGHEKAEELLKSFLDTIIDYECINFQNDMCREGVLYVMTFGTATDPEFEQQVNVQFRRDTNHQWKIDDIHLLKYSEDGERIPYVDSVFGYGTLRECKLLLRDYEESRIYTCSDYLDDTEAMEAYSIN